MPEMYLQGGRLASQTIPWADTVVAAGQTGWKEFQCAATGRAYYKNEAYGGVCTFDPRGYPFGMVMSATEQKVMEEKKSIEAEIKKMLQKATIEFEGGKHELLRKGKETVDNIAEKLQQLPPGSRVEVHGHTCCGTEGRAACSSFEKCHNKELSKNRCMSVVERFKSQGVQDLVTFEAIPWGCTEQSILSKKLVRIFIK